MGSDGGLDGNGGLLIGRRVGDGVGNIVTVVGGSVGLRVGRLLYPPGYSERRSGGVVGRVVGGGVEGVPLGLIS